MKHACFISRGWNRVTENHEEEDAPEAEAELAAERANAAV